MDPPNILFVFADQLRGSSLGHAGQEQVITPNMDRLAREGIRFTRAVANAPLCSPMRASLLTGLHPLSHGVIGNDVPLREDVPCIAKSLADLGYETAYIGKWHLDGPDRGCFTPPGPRRQGFHFWAAQNCNHNYYESFYYRDSPEPIWNQRYEPSVQTDIAIKYLKEAASRKSRFCLFVSFGPPHCPYRHVPDRFQRMYDPDSIAPRPNSVNPDLSVIAGYYAHITALDWNLGRLLSALDELDISNETLVIFTSDHGDMLFSQNRGWKCKPWCESVIVPFIARWPGVIPSGLTEDVPFGLVNVMPTLVALCGGEIPEEVDGIPYPHLLLGRGGPRPRSTPIYLYLKATRPSVDPWRGIVTRDHTYARFRDEPWILYDDRNDPYQLRNLAGDPAYRSLAKSLDEELERWLEELCDPFEDCWQVAARLGVTVNEYGIVPYHISPSVRDEIIRLSQDRERRIMDDAFA